MKTGIRFLLGLSVLLIATSAHAQAPRTWVAASGNDASTFCSRTEPCRTFAGAIAKTARFGEISVMDAGDFGSIVITKSVTINGGSTLAGILVDSTSGIIVNITTPSDPGFVILRGLSINGGGTGLDGIRYLAGSRLVIEDCSIYGFTRNGIYVSFAGKLVVSNTALSGGANGINVVSANALYLENCAIQGFSISGLLVENSAAGIQIFAKNSVMRFNGDNSISAGKAVFENCRFEASSQSGLGVFEGAKATLHNCVIAGNSFFGLYCAFAGSQALLDGCQIFNNSVGLRADSLTQIRVSNSNITHNTTGLSAATGRTRGEIRSRTSSGALTNTLESNRTDGIFTGSYTAK